MFTFQLQNIINTKINDLNGTFSDAIQHISEAETPELGDQKKTLNRRNSLVDVILRQNNTESVEEISTELNFPRNQQNIPTRRNSLADTNFRKTSINAHIYRQNISNDARHIAESKCQRKSRVGSFFRQSSITEDDDEIENNKDLSNDKDNQNCQPGQFRRCSLPVTEMPWIQRKYQRRASDAFLLNSNVFECKKSIPYLNEGQHSSIEKEAVIAKTGFESVVDRNSKTAKTTFVRSARHNINIPRSTYFFGIYPYLLNTKVICF